MGGGTVQDWVMLTALVGVGLVVLVMFLRARSRRARAKRFAKREGLVWLGRVDPLPRAWADIACFRMSQKGRTVDCVAGERHGRAFALVEHHYGSSGPEVRTGSGVALFSPALWLFAHLLGRTHDPGFSAAVVECSLPPQPRTHWAKRDLAPWKVEFGEEASVIRLDDGFASPGELLAAVDRLNGVIDELLSAPSSAS